MSTPSNFLRALSGLLFAATLTTTAFAQCNLLAIGDDSPISPTSTKLWDVNKLTGAASNPRVLNAAPFRAPTSMAYGLNGVLYGVSLGTPGDTPPGSELFSINPATGAVTPIAPLSQWHTVEGDVAVDPISGALYAVNGIGDLFTINTTNGVCTSIGTLPLDLPGGGDYSGLSFDDQGRLWVWSTFGPVIRRIDKTNAAVLSTVSLSPSPGGSVGGLAFDPTSGKMLIAGGTGAAAKLSTVDPITGVVTPIGFMTGMDSAWAIRIDLRDCATVTQNGSGCVTRFASFYEAMTASAMDLAGKKVSATWNGNGYTVTTGPGSGFTVPSSAVMLPLGNDTSVVYGSYGLSIGSNGWLARGPGNSVTPTPTPALLLNQPSTQISAWTDLDPSDPFSGFVFYDEPAPGIARATWDGVVGTGTTGLNWIQITWNIFTDDWTIEFGALATTNPQPWLVGFSPGGPNLDPGASDVSTFGGSPKQLSAVDVLPLTLTAINRPVQTVSAVNVNVLTTNIEPTAILHLGMVGLSSPGVSLSFLGLPPECVLWASPDLIVGPAWFPPPVQPWTALTLPALPPSVSGAVFHCQSITFDSNGLGPTTRVSNGLKCVVGLN